MFMYEKGGSTANDRDLTVARGCHNGGCHNFATARVVEMYRVDLPDRSKVSQCSNWLVCRANCWLEVRRESKTGRPRAVYDRFSDDDDAIVCLLSHICKSLLQWAQETG